jgi:hypothetical protein
MDLKKPNHLETKNAHIPSQSNQLFERIEQKAVKAPADETVTSQTLKRQ